MAGFSENPEAHVTRILVEIFKKANDGDFDSSSDPFPLENKLDRPEDRVYPNFQPIDEDGVSVSDQIRLLLPAVVYQSITGAWNGSVDIDLLSTGLVRFGKPQLLAQNIQIDVRDQIYPRAVNLADAIVKMLIQGQRVLSVSGPTFTYSQEPGEAELHRRIYTFGIMA